LAGLPAAAPAQTEPGGAGEGKKDADESSGQSQEKQS